MIVGQDERARYVGKELLSWILQCIGIFLVFCQCNGGALTVTLALSDWLGQALYSAFTVVGL